MWKVTNNQNYVFLNSFKLKIIIKIFKIILELSGQRMNSCSKKDFWKNTFSFRILNKEHKELIDYIMNVQLNKVRFSEVIVDLLTNNNRNTIKRIIRIYIIQNKKIESQDYAIVQQNVPDEIKRIFIDFYYNKFFVDQNIWSRLNLSEYNRTAFHENFKNENNLSVCPYCDIDTVVTNSNNNIEHFFPKSKYPLICMNPYNLISSCIACNKAHEGKGDTAPTHPISTPYSEEIQDYIEFDMDFTDRKISLINKGSDRHRNYLKLLKLNNRYQTQSVFNSLDKKAKTLFDLCSKSGTIDMDVLESYLRLKAKDENLIVALNHLIKKYPQYRQH